MCDFLLSVQIFQLSLEAKELKKDEALSLELGIFGFDGWCMFAGKERLVG